MFKDLNLQIVPKDCALRKKCPHWKTPNTDTFQALFEQCSAKAMWSKTIVLRDNHGQIFEINYRFVQVKQKKLSKLAFQVAGCVL